jgi:hypothetical protein
MIKILTPSDRRLKTLALVTILFLACATNSLQSQTFTRDDYSIPIVANGAPLEHPFTGGINQPMHQFADIDADGDLDLFIYEVNEGNLFFYRNLGTAQVPLFQHEREPFEKPPVFGWFKLTDINGDQKLDLLTSTGDANTLVIYVNEGTPQVPSFALLTTALLDSAGLPVYAESFSIASLCDIDADADLDFFSLNSVFGTINYYENIGDAVNMLLAFRTDRWQDIQICTGCGQNRPKLPQPSSLHGNGTMDFADVDNDADLDLFYGDLFDTGLFFYENIGTPSVAIMDSITGDFPIDDPVVTAGFNQPTMVDIDDDGDVDMFVSVLFPLVRVDNFRFYENQGTPENYTFHQITSNYIETLDLGLQASPAFVDIDADGDQDLFVGSLDGKVAFLRNTGTTTEPAFLLEDSNFVSSTVSFTYAPSFADIDADGDMDMFLGHFNGKIEFYRNAGNATSANFERELWIFDTLTVSNYAAPAFFDVDADGDFDLFVGRALGTITYYRNDGTPQAWSFSLAEASYLGIDVGDHSKPVFFDEDGDGDLDLLIGSRLTSLHFYRNNGSPGDPFFTLVTDNYASIDSIREGSPAMTDIDADGDQDLMIGNYRGGIEFYRNGPVVSVESDNTPSLPITIRLFQNYPNPFNSSTTIRFELEKSSLVDLGVFNLLGQPVGTLTRATFGPGLHTVRWEAGESASGTYIVRLTAHGETLTRRVLLVK